MNKKILSASISAALFHHSHYLSCDWFLHGWCNYNLYKDGWIDSETQGFISNGFTGL